MEAAIMCMARVVVVFVVFVVVMVRLRLVMELCVGMEAATMGVEVESRVVRSIGREVVSYPSSVTLGKVDGKACSLWETLVDLGILGWKCVWLQTGLWLFGQKIGRRQTS